MPIMKNILVIDAAENCSYSVFQATEDEFKEIFPGSGQDIEYAEDLIRRIGDRAAELLAPIWERPVAKKNAMGIHGTLFYEMVYRKRFYRSKREADIDPKYINAAQRETYKIDRN